MTAGALGSRQRWVRRAAASWRSSQWTVIALGAATAFGLGVIGFDRRSALTGEERSFLDCAYLSLQLFTLESGSVPPPVPAALQISRFLAPVVGAVGAVAAATTLFGAQISRVRLGFARRHAVVCGLGDRGVRIAEDMLRQGMLVVAVERDGSEPNVRRVQEAGAAVVIADAAEVATLRRVRADRARYVVAVCPDDGDNAEIVTRLSELVVDRRSHAPVTAFVHVDNTDLCDLLAERSLCSAACDGLRLEFFNVRKSGARAMLSVVPPVPRHQGAALHVAVIGTGKLGRSLVLQMARAWWEARNGEPERPRVTLVDRNADEMVELLRLRAPRIDEACELVAVPVDHQAPAFERAAFLYQHGRLAVDAVYVCRDDDAQALADALTVERHTRGHGVRIAVRMSGEGGLAVLLRGRGIGGGEYVRGVSVLDATCSMDALLGGAHDSIAQAIHEDYVRKQEQAGITSASNPSLVQWELLPEDLRESNRGQADHIAQKLAALGLSIVPVDDWGALPPAFTDEQVEQLARLEHERWMRERIAAGWRFGAGEKDLERRTSPHLVAWEQLDESVRDLDRDAVRAIPSLLAGAGLGVR